MADPAVIQKVAEAIAALVDDEFEDPIDIDVEMLRLRAAHQALEMGDLIVAAGILYGLQSRIATLALADADRQLGGES